MGFNDSTIKRRENKANGPSWQIIATGAVSLILILIVAMGAFWTSRIEANEISIKLMDETISTHDTELAVIQVDVKHIRRGVDKLLNGTR